MFLRHVILIYWRLVVVSCIEIKFNCYNKMDAQIHSTSMNSYEYVHNVLVP